MATVAERAIAIVAEQLRVPAADVTPEKHLVDDLKADSLDIVDLVIALEEAFSSDDRPLEITDEAAEEIHTVQDVLSFLESRGIS